MDRSTFTSCPVPHPISCKHATPTMNMNIQMLNVGLGKMPIEESSRNNPKKYWQKANCQCITCIVIYCSHKDDYSSRSVALTIRCGNPLVTSIAENVIFITIICDKINYFSYFLYYCKSWVLWFLLCVPLPSLISSWSLLLIVVFAHIGRITRLKR